MRRLGGLVGIVALALGTVLAAPPARSEVTDNGKDGERDSINRGDVPPSVACNRPPSTPGGSQLVRHLPTGPVVDGTQRYTAGICVYLPRGYDAATGTQYPVLYLLHGGGGDQADWVSFGQVQATADGLGADLIVVMPDASDGAENRPGGNGVWYDHPDGLQLNETYVVEHVIPYVDATFRTIARRDGRAVAGLSNGGLGATVLAAKHPDLFVAASTMSGNLGGYLHDYDQQDRPMYRAGNTPTPLAGNLEHVDVIQRWGSECAPDGDLVVDLCLSWGFEQFFRYDNGRFRDTLDALAAEHPGYYDHVYGDGPGSHAWRWWSAWLRDEHLPYLLERLTGPEADNLADVPAPAPASFRYQSISDHFTIWGYDVTVTERAQEGFTALTDVTPTSLTVTGTGHVRILTPTGAVVEADLDGTPRTFPT